MRSIQDVTGVRVANLAEMDVTDHNIQLQISICNSDTFLALKLKLCDSSLF